MSRTEPGFPPYVFLGATDREPAPVACRPTAAGGSLPRACSEAATDAKLSGRGLDPGALRAAARHARDKVVDITRRAHAAMEQLRAPLRRPTPPPTRPSQPSRLIH